jgi:hypothetical protein
VRGYKEGRCNEKDIFETTVPFDLIFRDDLQPLGAYEGKLLIVGLKYLAVYSTPVVFHCI